MTNRPFVLPRLPVLLALAALSSQALCAHTDADAHIEADLSAAQVQGAARVFLGDYGTGKTHALELAQRRALAQNFLCAHVVLDPQETPPSHPKRVWRALCRSLRYPDRPAENALGLRPLLERALERPAALKRFGVHPRLAGERAERLAAGEHLYLSPTLSHLRQIRESEDHAEDYTASEAMLLDWLEGHPSLATEALGKALRRVPGRHPKIYSLLDFRPWSRIFGYLLSGLATLAQEAGYAGLALGLDEAEFYALLSGENRGFARHLFKAWTAAAIGTEGLPFDPEELEIGGYGVQQSLPARYGSGGLYVLYAMTPMETGVSALSGAVPAEQIHELRALGDADYAELCRRVCLFYASAHADWSLPKQVVGPLSKVLAGLIASGYVSNPRHAMKFVIEFLDIVRFHPDRVGAVVRNLQLQLL